MQHHLEAAPPTTTNRRRADADCHIVQREDTEGERHGCRVGFGVVGTDPEGELMAARGERAGDRETERRAVGLSGSDRLGQLRNRNHSGRGARHIDPRQNWFSAVVDQFEDDLR